jgi:hypothetical protein
MLWRNEKYSLYCVGNKTNNGAHMDSTVEMGDVRYRKTYPQHSLLTSCT